MNVEELAKFQQLLAAYDQALRLQRMRERTIETYRQYLWKAANHFNRCPDDLSADERHSKATNDSIVAPCLRDPSSGAGNGYEADSGFDGTRGQ